MIANRRILGTTSRKSSSRLLASLGCMIDRPVTLPPGRARLASQADAHRVPGQRSFGRDTAAGAYACGCSVLLVSLPFSGAFSGAFLSFLRGCASAQSLREFMSLIIR
ncbi:MAG: hypothetical protein QOD29_2223 [Alphaproteobacteria bacterium]|jgi:hypothetical protein|nr:hypothetical protein [Alphaproteobacteria bacterium]